MSWFKSTLAYDGTAYHGWQSQDGQPTIQQAFETGIFKVTNEKVRATASGRTDAGVHAAGQVVGFCVATDLSATTFRRALQANTPHDIYVLKLEEVRAGFHAIRDARFKRYRYLIQDAKHHEVLARHCAWQVPCHLNIGAMQQGALILRGTHDFRCFEASGSPRKSTVRTISQLTVEWIDRDEFPRIVLQVTADGFLYNMVRNIVGSLVEVGREAVAVSWLHEVLESRDRKKAGPTAPPHGLTLMEVDYEPGVLLDPTNHVPS